MKSDLVKSVTTYVKVTVFAYHLRKYIWLSVSKIVLQERSIFKSILSFQIFAFEKLNSFPSLAIMSEIPTKYSSFASDGFFK